MFLYGSCSDVALYMADLVLFLANIGAAIIAHDIITFDTISAGTL